MQKGECGMTNNLIITIGRQCGSGGKLIGEMLAEKMGVKCYDKELLAMAAKHSGLCEELFEKHDERPTSSFLYSLVMDSYSMGYTASGYSDMPINHKIFLAQFDTIKKLADEASCVIVGRCADYALEDYPNVVSVFITGCMAFFILGLCMFCIFFVFKLQNNPTVTNGHLWMCLGVMLARTNVSRFCFLLQYVH